MNHKSFFVSFFTKKEILLVLLLASCGDLPRPFAGKPGANAIRLATPPIARLAVIPSQFTALDNAHTQKWASDLASALVDGGMPAVVGAPGPIDWSVIPRARLTGPQVIPEYELHDGTGKLRGTIDGAPIAATDWPHGDLETLQQSAQTAAPKIGDLLTSIEAQRLQADPNSLYHRAAKVVVADGTGAPGDGDQSLPKQLREYLKFRGVILTDNDAEADYKVHCEVKVAATSDPTLQSVQIIWLITDSRGREAGRVAQLNNVPAHSLDGHWYTTAQSAAQEAAGGIAEVMRNQLPKG